VPCQRIERSEIVWHDTLYTTG